MAPPFVTPHTSSNKGAKRGPVLTAVADDSEIYGTFAGRDPSSIAAPAPAHAPTASSRTTRVLRAAGLAGALLLAAGVVTNTGTSSLFGSSALRTTADNAVVDRIVGSVLSATEQTFVDGIDTAKLREHLHFYARAPHAAGSQRDYATAVYTAQQMQSFGINATIQTYYPLLSTPVHRRLAIVAPLAAAQELNLTEGAVPGDACTTDATALPPFLAYAATGNVTASVVYANYGRPEDFDWLAAQNVTLQNKIALVRYGGNFRGLKVMAAEQRGVAGVLIYSDPQDDGFVQGATYPNGSWRPADSFQRGSLQYLSLAGGDPLTPGFPSTRNASYLEYEDVTSIPHIPALPLSYRQAQIILEALGGTAAPSEWQGGLMLKDDQSSGYRLGDDEVLILNLDLVMDNSVGPIWNVIGTIEGTEAPAQQVLIGNHRDAWVCGAVDPNSGSATLLEIARGFGNLLTRGWRPQRTLVLGSWDGEEYGLLGSTEYAEDNAAVFTAQAVAYINVDSVLGPLVSASAAPSIGAFLLATARAIPALLHDGNETATSLFEQWVTQAGVRRATLGAAASDRGMLAPDHLIGFMGSGSDFTSFYQHLGIVSANLAFGLSDDHPYGVYHSSMDSVPYYEAFADPHYATQRTAAQWWGVLAMRLATTPLLPFDYSTYGLVMAEDLAGFETRLALAAVAVDFTQLHAAIQTFSLNAMRFQTLVAAAKTDEYATNAATVALRKSINTKLIQLERQLLLPEGLPHRPWYKHVIFGPGFYEGYSGAAFPGIDDAIAFNDNATVVQEHVDDVTRTVQKAAAYLLA